MRWNQIDLESYLARDHAFSLERRKLLIRCSGNIGIEQIVETDVAHALAGAYPVADPRRAGCVYAEQFIGFFQSWIVGEHRLEPGNPVGSLACFAVGNAPQMRRERTTYRREHLTRIAQRHTTNQVNMPHYDVNRDGIYRIGGAPRARGGPCR